MQADIHKSIELRAYQLWEAAGRPFGRSDEFWTLASSELATPVAVVKKARKAAAPKAKAATSAKAKAIAEPVAKPKAAKAKTVVAKKAVAKKAAAKKR